MIKNRIILFNVILIIGALLITSRAFQLQGFKNDKLNRLTKKQFHVKTKETLHRGSILDEKGRELAFSSRLPSLYVKPAELNDPYHVAVNLGKILGTNWKKIYQGITKARRKKIPFLWIKRKISTQKMELITKRNFKGVYFKNETTRHHPFGKIASHILGFTNIDLKGIEGLELEYNNELSIKRGKTITDRDARGIKIFDVNKKRGSFSGSTLVTTINKDIQYYSESVLRDQITKSNATSGSVIIMNADTGGILAMANYPEYNPDDLKNSKTSERRNRAVTDVFEPGSTMKIFTVASALQHGLLKKEDRFNGENGVLQIGKHKVREADKDHVFKWMNFADILTRSSNVGTTKIGFLIGENKLYKSLKRFGFGSKTGIDYPGETKGVLPLIKRKIKLSNVSFGQGISVTPIQLINALTVIANGGFRVKPHFISKIIFPDGRINVINNKIFSEEIMSYKNTELLTKALLNVTTPDGGGYNGAVRGYQIAGKTGTSQVPRKNGKGYAPGKFIASFMGFTANTDPKLVAIVKIDEPKFPYYGNSVAAPVFSKVMSYALEKTGIEPSLSKITPLALLTGENKDEPQKISNTNKTTKNTLSIKTAERLNVDTIRKALLDKNIMPDLSGFTLREVASIFKESSQDLEIKGSGFVVKQLPLPGESIDENNKINVWLKAEN